MTWKDFIKYLYDEGVYNDEDVAGFVRTGQLTPNDYKDITKKDYVAPTNTASK